MKNSNVRITMLFIALQAIFFFSAIGSGAQVDNTQYHDMAPLARYMVADETAETSLARSAAPASISSAAEIMVLRPDGYATTVKGTNNFVCLVERSWANTTDDSQFWNPKVRAPHCFNPAAAKTVLPIYLMKSRLVLTGKTKAEIALAMASALERKELPAPAPGAMVYMMSRQQYLSDRDMSWHPHLMFFVLGDVEKSWGANLPGSPVMAAFNPEERVTTFFLVVREWSDGTSGQ